MQDDNLQLQSAILLASVLVGYGLGQSDWIRSTLLFGVSVIGLNLLIYPMLSKQRRRLREEAARFSQELDSMSPEQAKLRAEVVLSQEAKCTPASGSPSPSVAELPSDVQSLFRQYESIRFRSGAILQIEQVREGFAIIGYAYDGELLCLRLSDGVLFEWDDPDSFPADGSEGSYSTLFHWIAVQ